MKTWKQLYRETAEIYRKLKPLFEEQYATLVVRIDRRDVRIASEVPGWARLENYPPRIEIWFDDDAILNIYGKAIVARIRAARGELVGLLAERFALKARAGVRIEKRWQRRLDVITLYKERDVQEGKAAENKLPAAVGHRLGALGIVVPFNHCLLRTT